MILQWTNKNSGEHGYVAAMRYTKGYFENTFDITKAKKYRSSVDLNKDMSFLASIGEMENNEFVTIN